MDPSQLNPEATAFEHPEFSAYEKQLQQDQPKSTKAKLCVLSAEQRDDVAADSAGKPC